MDQPGATCIERLAMNLYLSLMGLGFSKSEIEKLATPYHILGTNKVFLLKERKHTTT